MSLLVCTTWADKSFVRSVWPGPVSDHDEVGGVQHQAMGE